VRHSYFSRYFIPCRRSTRRTSIIAVTTCLQCRPPSTYAEFHPQVKVAVDRRNKADRSNATSFTTQRILRPAPRMNPLRGVMGSVMHGSLIASLPALCVFTRMPPLRVFNGEQRVSPPYQCALQHALNAAPKPARCVASTRRVVEMSCMNCCPISSRQHLLYRERTKRTCRTPY